MDTNGTTRPLSLRRWRYRKAGEDGQPGLAIGRVVRLWERQITATCGAAQVWEPVTFRTMLEGLGTGGRYDRTAARAIEAMVGGGTTRGVGAYFRFRSAAECAKELSRREMKP